MVVGHYFRLVGKDTVAIIAQARAMAATIALTSETVGQKRTSNL